MSGRGPLRCQGAGGALPCGPTLRRPPVRGRSPPPGAGDKSARTGRYAGPLRAAVNRGSIAGMVVDLSHPIENGMPVYPDDPVPRLADVPTAPPWKLTSVTLGSHSGTHIDAASHYIPGGKTIDRYPLERFVLPGVVVRVRGLAGAVPIAWGRVAGQLPTDVRGLAAVLDTGWASHWGSERYFVHPYLSEETCRELVAAGVSLVGTDAPSVDDTAGGSRHAHQSLLGEDVLIVENLANLERLTPGRVYRFAFAPLPLTGVDGSPVRAFAWEQ